MSHMICCPLFVSLHASDVCSSFYSPLEALINAILSPVPSRLGIYA